MYSRVVEGSSLECDGSLMIERFKKVPARSFDSAAYRCAQDDNTSPSVLLCLRAFVPLHRKAFTFVELMIGMMVTSIVLGAMAMFTFGVAEGWTQSESAQSVFLAGSMAADRFNRAIRSAKLIDPNRIINGSMDNSTAAASCMYWRDDGTVLLDDGTTLPIAANSDGKIQFSEMGLIEFDQATKTIWQYTVVFPVGMTTAQMAAADYTQAPPLPLPTAAVFKSASHVTAKALAHNVTACQFFLVSGTANQRPMLEFVLNIDDGKASTVQYGAATVRCPNEEPQ